MNTIAKIVLAASLATSITAVSTGVLAASGRPAPAATGDRAAFVPPADYVQLTDDTGTLTIAVPNTWTDVDTAPLVTDGGSVPRLTAATDYDVFHDTFDAPGVEYVALPYDADQQGVMTEFGLTGGCASTRTEAYNDGAFVGLHGIWTECGTTQLAEWHQLVVSPTDNSRTLILQIQITGPAELAVLQNLIDSFNTGSGTPTTPTVPTPTAAAPTAPVPTAAAPTVPTPTAAVPTVAPPTVAPPTVATPTVPTPTVAGAVPAGFVQLLDDSGTVSVVVPTTWTDVDTAAFIADDGTALPQITAATNIDTFNTTFSAPGVLIGVVPFIRDTEDAATEQGLDAGTCPANAVQPFANAQLTGHANVFTGCGSSGQAEYHVIIASPVDQSLSFLIIAQSTGPADQAAIATVLASAGPAGATGAAVPPTAATTPVGPATTAAGVPVPPSTVPVIPPPATAAPG